MIQFLSRVILLLFKSRWHKKNGHTVDDCSYELFKIIVKKEIENQNSENEFCNKKKLNTKLSQILKNCNWNLMVSYVKKQKN